MRKAPPLSHLWAEDWARKLLQCGFLSPPPLETVILRLVPGPQNLCL